MPVITENGILLKIKDTNPEQRYKKMSRAVTAAFRWYGCLPRGFDCDRNMEGNNLVALSDLLEAIISSTLINDGDVCILLDNQGEDELHYYVSALIAAVRWSVHERRNCDDENLTEIARLLEQFTNNELRC